MGTSGPRWALAGLCLALAWWAYSPVAWVPGLTMAQHARTELKATRTDATLAVEASEWVNPLRAMVAEHWSAEGPGVARRSRLTARLSLAWPLAPGVYRIDSVRPGRGDFRPGPHQAPEIIRAASGVSEPDRVADQLEGALTLVSVGQVVKGHLELTSSGEAVSALSVDFEVPVDVTP